MLTTAATRQVTVDSSASLSVYMTHSSYHRLVVSTRDGIFIVQLLQTDPPGGDFGSDTIVCFWRLLRSTDGGATFIETYRNTGAGHPPVIAADPLGVLYIITSRFTVAGIAGTTSFYRFDRSNNFSAPTATSTTTATGTFGGKTVIELDWPRRQIYFAVWNGYISTLDLNGNWLSTLQVFAQTANNVPEYLLLSLDENGVLYMGMTSTPKVTVDNLLYRSIHLLKSPDGGVTWQNMNSAIISLPTNGDETGSSTLVILSDEFVVNTWLASILARNGKVHLLYQASSSGMVGQNIADRMHYVRFDVASGAREYDSYPTALNFQGDALSINDVTCYLARNPATGRLYAVGRNPYNSATTNLVALYSDDGGNTWHDYAQSNSYGGVSGNQLVTYIGGAAVTPNDGSLYTVATLNDFTSPALQFTAMSVRTRLYPTVLRGPYDSHATTINLGSPADPTNGNCIFAANVDLLVVTNNDSSTHTITIVSAANAQTGRTGDIVDAVPAGATHIYGRFPLDGWRQADGDLYISATSALLYINAIQLPKLNRSDNMAYSGVTLYDVNNNPVTLVPNALVALSSPPANLNANSETVLTFATTVRHVFIQNNSTVPIGVEFDATATPGSLQVPAASGGVPGTLYVDFPVLTGLHLYSTVASALNSNALPNVIVKGWS